MRWVHRTPWKYVHLLREENTFNTTIDNRYLMSCGKKFFLRGYLYFDMFKTIQKCPECERIQTMCELAE